MKIVNSGETYDIYGDSLCTYDRLPTLTYYVRFAERKGFFLERGHDMNVGESKVYGVHMDKVHKVLRAFNVFERNLGVILSGDKGIGKSLFVRCLSVLAGQQSIPTIIVDTYYDGIASFLESIEQEVLVVFDEFDKVFNKEEYQTKLLGLFDGISSGKKLFVITCNMYQRLNEYLLNRPGRFHYHLRFNYPNREEIQEYLLDKVEEQYHDQIPGVISFAHKIRLNYDCLRAIAFELNTGVNYKEALLDLNILNVGRSVKYEVKLLFENGVIAADTINIDSDNMNETCSAYLEDPVSKNNWVDVSFYFSDVVFDEDGDDVYVPIEKVNISFDGRYEKLTKAVENVPAKRLILNRISDKSIHYAL